MTQLQHPTSAQAWWRYGHVWLIIAGPAIVVVAGFITLWLAIRTPDPVITPDQYRQGQDLYRAADQGHYVKVRRALKAGANVNHASVDPTDVTQHGRQMTALHVSAGRYVRWSVGRSVGESIGES